MIGKTLGHYHITNQLGKGGMGEVFQAKDQKLGRDVAIKVLPEEFARDADEMLTGRVAFRGEDVSEILASVIKVDVRLDLLPANIHPRVREVIIRCLQRDLNRRYQDIRNARYEIEQALADPRGVVQPVSAAQPRAGFRAILWAGSIVVMAIAAGVAVWRLKPPEPKQVMRFDYDLPDGQQFSDLTYPALAISPDGRRIAYATEKGLFMRSIDESNAKLVAGTDESTSQPFFSPDGKWIGYLSVSTSFKLKKIDINGGAPAVLCDAIPYGLSWGNDGTIFYGRIDGGITRVSANGGTPEALVKARPGINRRQIHGRSPAKNQHRPELTWFEELKQKVPTQ